MDAHASSQFVGTQPLAMPIADTVYRSLKSAIDHGCAERHTKEVAVQRTAEAQPMQVQLRCGELVKMVADVLVRHVGGNVYDIVCTIEDGPARRFVYSPPQGVEPPLPPVPRLGHELAGFLLDELEQCFGRMHLREKD